MKTRQRQSRFTSSEIRIRERFTEKVDWTPDANSCLMWTAGKNNTGYGQLFVDGKVRKATHVAFYLAHGRYPETGKVMAHTCEAFYPAGDNGYRACVNIDHLQEVPRGENIRQAFENGRAEASREASRRNVRTPVAIAAREQACIGNTWGRGRNNGNSKLTESDIPKIMGMIKAGFRQVAIARVFGVNPRTISAIKTGKVWAYARG